MISQYFERLTRHAKIYASIALIFSRMAKFLMFVVEVLQSVVVVVVVFVDSYLPKCLI